MKVLFLLPESPYPPDSGPRHHTFGLLRIAARRHKCHLVGFYRGEKGLERWKQLETVVPNAEIQVVFPEAEGSRRLSQTVSNLAHLRPLVLRGYQDSGVAKWLTEVVSKHAYDLIHIDQFKMAYYGPFCQGTPTVLVPYDAFSLKSYRAFKASKSLREKAIAFYLYLAFSRLERDLYHRFSLVCPVSWVDTRWLAQRDPRLHLETVEIPVADEYLAQGLPGHSTTGEPHLICAGWFASDSVAQGAIQFLRDVVPVIRQAIPNVQITVWGHSPARALKSLLQRMPDVRIIEWADDYIGMLKSAWVYVYPQACGAGIQTKVQQAMALGVPVVARRETLDPLYVTSGEQAFICKNSQEMAHAIIRLLKSPELRSLVGLAASTHMRDRFSMPKISDRLSEAYQQALLDGAARH